MSTNQEQRRCDREREMGDGMVWSGQWVAERLGVELGGRRGADRAAGAGAAPQPQAGPSAGLERARQARTAVAGRRVRRRAPASASGCASCSATTRRPARSSSATRRRPPARPLRRGRRGPRPVSALHPPPGRTASARAGGFEESHSHATSHLLLPEDPALLAGDGPLVLVDDEFSTGNTVLNTIRDLHDRYPRERYVVVALVDMRSAADRAGWTASPAEIGARVDLVALASGTVRLPDGVLAPRAGAGRASTRPGRRAAPRPRTHATPNPRRPRAGPQGCRTADGTASRRRTAPAWTAAGARDGPHAVAPRHRSGGRRGPPQGGRR